MSSSAKKLSTFELLFSWQNRTLNETKNSAEKSLQLASPFLKIFSAALKLLLGFSQQLQKPRENSNVLNTNGA